MYVGVRRQITSLLPPFGIWIKYLSLLRPLFRPGISCLLSMIKYSTRSNWRMWVFLLSFRGHSLSLWVRHGTQHFHSGKSVLKSWWIRSVLKYHIIKSWWMWKQNTDRKGTGLENFKPQAKDLFPLSLPGSTALQNTTRSWEPNILVCELMWDISHLKRTGN